jgi:hypothetical protein
MTPDLMLVDISVSPRKKKCNLSVIFDRPIICKTVKYIEQSDSNSWCVLDFETNSSSLIDISKTKMQ